MFKRTSCLLYIETRFHEVIQSTNTSCPSDIVLTHTVDSIKIR